MLKDNDDIDVDEMAFLISNIEKHFAKYNLFWKEDGNPDYDNWHISDMNKYLEDNCTEIENKNIINDDHIDEQWFMYFKKFVRFIHRILVERLERKANASNKKIEDNLKHNEQVVCDVCGNTYSKSHKARHYETHSKLICQPIVEPKQTYQPKIS